MHVPWFLDVDSGEEIHRWGIRTCQTGFSEAANDTFGDPPEQLDTQITERYTNGEEGVDIIRAFRGAPALKTNVNTPNRG